MEPKQAMLHYRGMIDLNITSYVMITRVASEFFDHENSGIIINVGSVAGYRHCKVPDGYVYSATKHSQTGDGLEGL